MLDIRESDLTILAATHGRGLFTGKINPDNSITWQERGPTNVGGRTRTIMIDPNDPTKKTIWAGSVSGGLWKTNNIDLVGIEENNLQENTRHKLSVFPNPLFGAEMTVQFELFDRATVSLKIYNTNGELVAVLKEGTFGRGLYREKWNPSQKLPMGTYFVILETASEQIVKKVMVVR